MRYRKRPVEIEAVRLPESYPVLHMSEVQEIRDFIGEDAFRANHGVVIRTLEGDMLATPGDWIIRGTKGELYPCKPDIFAEIYEPVFRMTPLPVCRQCGKKSDNPICMRCERGDGAPRFTPGPWEVSPTDEQCHAVVAPPRDADDEIGPWFTAIISCTDDAVEDANARLIAAAPELYEALSDLIGKQGICSPDENCRQCKAALSALAKARGDQ